MSSSDTTSNHSNGEHAPAAQAAEAARATPTSPSSDADARLTAEIEAAMAGVDMASIMSAPSVATAAASTAAVGQASGSAGAKRTRRGTVNRVVERDVFVEFDAKSSGVCPLSHFNEPPAVGTAWDFIVERLDPFEGILILARPGSVLKGTAWSDLEVGMVVEARCVGMNAGGLDMEVAHKRAFMPTREVDVRHVPDVSVFLGQKLACEIIELRRERGRMVVSHRRVAERERREKSLELLATLEVGQTRTATIVGLQTYGAFADLGGIDGLIPIGELSHEHLKDPAQAVKVGDVVDVVVKRVDLSAKPPRVSLSRKDLLTDPVRTKMEEIVVGATVSGTVSRLTEFGAFVELAPGLDGLVHVSEISWERIPNPTARLKRGQVIEVKVLSVDPAAKRVSLSIKQLQEPPARPEPTASEGQGGPGGDRGGPRGRGGFGGKRGSRDAEERVVTPRADDPEMRKLLARFGGGKGTLKGGLG